MMDYQKDAPEILRDFLAYHETIKAHSPKTVDEYYLDLRNFLRYLKRLRAPEQFAGKRLDEIDIGDIGVDFVSRVTLSELYSYMSYLSRERIRNQQSATPEYGLKATSQVRKIAAIRSFFNYLANKTHQIPDNPVKELDSPKIRRTLPKYLTLEESITLLQSVESRNPERDYCILTLFLNCGLRISELVGQNLSDLRGDSLRVTGKGGKTRIVYLNAACQDALQMYLQVRRSVTGKDANALFLSTRNQRISRAAVHIMVKHRMEDAGMESEGFSSHKLRHTAATLMLKNGVNIRAVQEVLGHDHLNTTQIYTHIDSDDLRSAAKATPLSRVKPKKG